MKTFFMCSSIKILKKLKFEETPDIINLFCDNCSSIIVTNLSKMDSTSYHPLLQVTKEEMETVRKSYNLDVQKINENLDIIDEWIKKQEHLVGARPYLKREILERFHILGKGSIEKTKKIIDQVLTIKGMIPEIFLFDENIDCKEFGAFIDNILLSPLPKINPKDSTRVFLIRFMNENFEDYNVIEFTRFACFVLETRIHDYEYIYTHHMVIDLKHVKSSVLLKLDPIIIRKCLVAFTDSYKLKVNGLHFINSPPFINKILFIFRAVLKEKISKRIHVHSTNEELYQHVSREIMPKDYGGDEMSCLDLSKHLSDFVKSESGRKIMESSSKIVADESKRSSIEFNQEYMGMPGSFKQLNVD